MSERRKRGRLPNPDPEAESTLGGLIRFARNAKGLPISGVPGVSRSYLSRLENGKVASPHPQKLEAIAAALDLSPEGLKSKAAENNRFVDRHTVEAVVAAVRAELFPEITALRQEVVLLRQEVQALRNSKDP